MDKTKALAKIKKCLALAKSANPTEAATAMRQAQILMAQHNLEQLDLDMADVTEASHGATSGKPQVWEVHLAHLVADALGCHVYLNQNSQLVWKRGRIQAPTHMAFVGLGGAADVAAYAFKVLQRQCVTQRQAHVRKQPACCKPITKTARGDAFAMGWVQGVRQLVKTFAGTPARTELLEAYMAAKHPNLGNYKAGRRDVGRNVRDDAAKGFTAAQTAKLHHGVAGKEGPALIGGSQ